MNKKNPSDVGQLDSRAPPGFVLALTNCVIGTSSCEKNTYPPTPAFAKAGAAPGTTAGVELFRAGFKCARQLPPSLAAAFAGPGLQPGPLPAHPSRQLPPSSWPSAFQHCSLPFACSSLLLGHSSLPFARLQTPKTPKTPKTLLCLHIALSC